MGKPLRAGLGWVPDLPDHRDKRFHRAVAHAKDSVRAGGGAGGDVAQRARIEATPVQARQTFQGWSLGEGALEKRSEKPGSEAIADRLKRAKAWAFSGTMPKLDWRDRGQRLSRVSRPLLLEQPPSDGKLPARVDLRPFLSPVEHQQQLGSCTAHAVMGLVEYLQIATTGQYVDGSRLFLYKATRELLHWTGDAGAYIRDTIKAMRLFGVCPEEYWPYGSAEFDAPPPAFCYAFASNYKAMSYYRIEGLREIQRSLLQGYPVAFGFTCFDSLFSEGVTESGFVPFPGPGERTHGGHAVLAVGYLDADLLGDAVPEYARGEEGWLVIRNSWGEDWGNGGYGFIPYRFIEGDAAADLPPLADDYWTLARLEQPDFDGASPAPFSMASGVGARAGRGEMGRMEG